MPSILDALANLSIHKDIKRSVRDSLITTVKTSPIEYLPNVKYLLCTCESDTSDELISNLRSELFAENSVSMKNTINEEDVDPDTIQVLLFTKVRNCLLANKQLADAWTKNISHSDATIKNRPLDIIITIILYDICAVTSKKRNLETLIRSRIKNEFFNVPSILETFEHFRSSIELSKPIEGKPVEPVISDF